MQLPAAGLVLALMLSATPALAQMSDAPPACATMDKALTGEFAAWPAKVQLVSAAGAPDLAKAELKVGQAYAAGLHPTRAVAYVTQPEKPGGSVAKGGLFSLKIDKAGVYRVGLGAGAWIDVLADGKPLVSTGHGHGPACSSVRKVVDFDLQPGLYIVQISANADPSLAIMVAKAP